MCTTYAGELAEQVLTRMLWSRRSAGIAGTHVPVWMFGSRAALAALIVDHDQTHPDAPADGEDRVTSILEHVLTVAGDVARAAAAHRDWVLGGGEGPEPANRYRCPVAGINARAHGRPDPQLLARARDVLTYLPTLAGAPESPRTTAGLIRELRAARDHEDQHDLPDVDDLDLP